MNEKPKEYYLLLIYSSLSENLNESEREELQDWLAQSEDHSALYDEVVSIWEMMDFGSSPDYQEIESAYQDFLNRQQNESFVSVNERRHKKGWMAYAAVAAGILVAFFAGLYSTSNSEKGIGNETVIAVNKGSHSKTTLPDGTEVWLNAETKIEIDKEFGVRERKIKIQGEAFFDVSHDKERPFIVQTDALDVRVHGTSFNLSCYPKENIRVALLKGSVELIPTHGSAMMLKPNDIVDYNVDKRAFLLAKESVQEELVWRESNFIFKDKRFELIIMELERAFDIDISVANKSILSKRFTGDFVNKESVIEILNVMSKVGEFSYEMHGSHILIK